MRRVLTLASFFLFVAWTPLPQGLTPPVRLTYPAPVEGFGDLAHAGSNGRGFFVASDGPPLEPYGWGMAFDERGQRLAEESSSTGPGFGVPKVASDGTNYLMVWRAWRENRESGELPSLFARRVSAEGRPIGDRILIRIGATDYSVSWDGSRYVVIFKDRNDVYVAKFITAAGVVTAEQFPMIGSESAANANGAVLSVTHQTEDLVNEQTLVVQALNTPPVTIGKGAQAVLGAGGNGEFVVAYHDDFDIWARRLDASGPPLADPVRVSMRSSEPRIAWVNDHWLIVFTRLRGASRHIEAVRLGSGMDATPFTIAEDATSPAVASNGSRALVTWRRNDSIREKAILDGTALSAVGPVHRRLGPTDSADIRMAAVGDATFIAVRIGFERTELWAAREGAARYLRTFDGLFTGLTGGPGHALLTMRDTWYVLDAEGNTLAERSSQTEFTANAPAVWANDAYRLAWRVDVGPFEFPKDIYLSDMTVTGDTHGRRLVSANGFRGPAVARGGDRMLVVWSERCAGCFAGWIIGSESNDPLPFQHQLRLPRRDLWVAHAFAASDGESFLLGFLDTIGELRLCRVEADGTVHRLGELPVEFADQPLWMGWTGEYYLILGKNLNDGDAESQLYAARVAADGTLLDEEFTRVLPGLTTPGIRSALIRENRAVELVLGGQDEPFGPQQLTWRKLAGPRRRAVR